MTHELDPATSAHFTPWEDPESGIRSYCLETDRAAWTARPYFTNPSVDASGRYLWFQAIDPPASTPTLGRYDAVADEVRVFPALQTDTGGPFVEPDSGAVYWTVDQHVYRRGPAPEDDIQHVGTVPEAAVGDRSIDSLASHLTRSPDGTKFAIDVEADSSWHVGTMDVETGEVSIWWSTAERRYNHAQFSPTRNDEILIAQDYWTDSDGVWQPYENRMWLLRRGEDPEPLVEEMPTREQKYSGRHGHEWWGEDGERVWYIDYEKGVEYVECDSGDQRRVWTGGQWHGHASRDGQLIVGDNIEPRNVLAYDRETDRELAIVSEMPQETSLMSRYHVHPHPRFECDDEFVIYTTTVDERVRLAITPVEALRERLA